MGRNLKPSIDGHCDIAEGQVDRLAKNQFEPLDSAACLLVDFEQGILLENFDDLVTSVFRVVDDQNAGCHIIRNPFRWSIVTSFGRIVEGL